MKKYIVTMDKKTYKSFKKFLSKKVKTFKDLTPPPIQEKSIPKKIQKDNTISDSSGECVCCGEITKNEAVSLCGCSFLCTDCSETEMKSGHYDGDGVWQNFYDEYRNYD